MKISDLIEMLETERRIHGDIEVHVQATEVDSEGWVAFGGSYYGQPYDVKPFRSTEELVLHFDKVIHSEDIGAIVYELGR